MSIIEPTPVPFTAETVEEPNGKHSSAFGAKLTNVRPCFGDDDEGGPDNTSQTSNLIYLRLDHIGKWEARLITLLIYAFSLFCILLAILNVVSNVGSVNDNTPDDFDDQPYYYTNAIGGTVCLALCFIVGSRFAWRWYRVVKMGRKWSPRRKSFAIDGAVLIGLGTLNAAFWMTPHWIAIAQTSRCNVTKEVTMAMGSLAILRYTMFSLIMMWAIVMVSNMEMNRKALPVTEKNADFLLKLDQPWREQIRIHRYKIIFWIILETLVIVSFINMLVPKINEQDTQCGLNTEQCGNEAFTIVSAVAQCLLMVVVMVLYWIYLYRAFRDHRHLPYAHYRLTNLWLKISKRHTTVLFIAIAAGIVLVEVVTQGDCVADVQVKLGGFTVNVAVTIFVLGSGILYMPSTATRTPAQVLKQEFSWTEGTLQRAITLRDLQARGSEPETTFFNRMLSGPMLKVLSSKERSKRRNIVNTPMFCIETAARLHYWARFAYQHDTPYSLMNIDDALQIYELNHFDYILEPETDSKVIFGWNDSRLVVAFRGTKSIANVKTDAKAWSCSYHTRNADTSRQSLPGTANLVQYPVRVHSGFFAAWTTNNFHQRVLDKVSEIFNDEDVMGNMRVLVTGHSLGGALGMLAAYEIAKENPLAKVTCYSFGSPRLGSKGFAALYNEAVPDTFSIVNNDDPIPRIPKFTYKRCGKRVSLNNAGDMIVAPTFFEVSVNSSTAGSMKYHRTGQYALSLAYFIKSQMWPSKRLPGGLLGALELARTVDLKTALMVDKMDADSLKDKSAIPTIIVTPVTKEEAVELGIANDDSNVIQEITSSSMIEDGQ